MQFTYIHTGIPNFSSVGHRKVVQNSVGRSNLIKQTDQHIIKACKNHSQRVTFSVTLTLLNVICWERPKKLAQEDTNINTHLVCNTNI